MVEDLAKEGNTPTSTGGHWFREKKRKIAIQGGKFQKG